MRGLAVDKASADGADPSTVPAKPAASHEQPTPFMVHGHDLDAPDQLKLALHRLVPEDPSVSRELACRGVFSCLVGWRWLLAGRFGVLAGTIVGTAHHGLGNLNGGAPWAGFASCSQEARPRAGRPPRGLGARPAPADRLPEGPLPVLVGRLP